MTPKLAIFRGVPFGYRSLTRDNDHAIEVRQYVGGPYWDIFENSRPPEEISLQAIFGGLTAETRRDAFIREVRKPGSGLLIHPDLGVMTVYVKSWSIATSGAETGIAAVDLAFVPAPKNLPGSEIIFSAALNAATISSAATAALTLAVAASGQDDTAIGSTMRSQSASASAALDVSSVAQGVERTEIMLALSDAATAAPSDLSAAWAAVTTAVSSRPVASSMLEGLRSTWQSAIELIAVDYLSGSAAAAVCEYIASLLVGRVAVLVLADTYPTYDDAQDSGLAAYGLIESAMLQMADAGNISAAISISNLMLSGLIRDTLMLPRRVVVESRALSSSLELAQMQYGDYTRAEQIEGDNVMPHPGFVGPMLVRLLTT